MDVWSGGGEDRNLPFSFTLLYLCATPPPPIVRSFAVVHGDFEPHPAHENMLNEVLQVPSMHVLNCQHWKCHYLITSKSLPNKTNSTRGLPRSYGHMVTHNFWEDPYFVGIAEKAGWHRQRSKARSARACARVQFAHIIHQLHCLTRCCAICCFRVSCAGNFLLRLSLGVGFECYLLLLSLSLTQDIAEEYFFPPRISSFLVGGGEMIYH